MKKIFILLISMLFSTIITNAQTLYSTDFMTEEEYNKWIAIDANNDAASWGFDSSAEPSKIFYTYNGENSADDWFISPAITSEKDGSVAVIVKVKGSSYGEKLELFMGEGDNIEDMTTRISEVLYLNNDITQHIYIVEVEASTPFHIGFHAISDADKWRLHLCEMTIKSADGIVDLQVADIISPVSDTNLSQEEIIVKVKNMGPRSVDSFDVSYSVNEGEAVTETVNQALAAGGVLEYTFITKADISASRQRYTIKAWTTHPGDIDISNDTASVKVLHKAPAALPYFMGFEEDEYTDDITFWNLNEDDGDWEMHSDPWYNLARTGDQCLAYNFDSNNNAEDWVILEPITIPEAGYYILKFWYSGDENFPENLGVYYGDYGDPSAMTNKIIEYAPFAHGDYEESINIIHIDNPKDIYIGFYAFSDKNSNWICVDDISFEKVDGETIDLMALPVTTPLDFVHKGTQKDINFKVRNLGVKEAAATVRATLSGNVIYEENITLPALEIKDIVIENALKELAAGLYTVDVEIISTEDIYTGNNSISHTFRVMDTPAALWDFEDGRVPSEFAFIADDEGTVDPGVGEVNEYGWGIVNIQEHDLYGGHVLAGTSRLDGTEQADRWCILPPFKASEESFMVWDARSFNPYYLETYSIMISKKGDYTESYYTEEIYAVESADFKTRGIDLSEYAGQEIHIAFRLTSKNCEQLILDNIGLYGGYLIEPLEIKATATPSEGRVKKLDNFTIDFENVESVALEENPTSSPYIASVDESGSLIHIANVKLSAVEGEPTKINAAIAQDGMAEITENGSYALVIPQDALIFNNDKTIDIAVTEFVFHYEISDAEVQYQISVSPAPGGDIEIDELSEMIVTFNGVQEIIFNEEAQYGSLQHLDTSDNAIEEFPVTFTKISDVACKLSLDTLPTEQGKYRLIIPEAIVIIKDNAGVIGHNKSFMADYNVTAYTNVEDITKEVTEINVYDINGVQILHKAKKDALKLLQSGVYLINGKKILIK
ncbi:MAG: choice-of-anchor J domain-containing protein [Bacteroidaceae bacterium]|nr:choice-of-anchor J domain-containing protein [Bacteroidaceae bacterium]